MWLLAVEEPKEGEGDTDSIVICCVVKLNICCIAFYEYLYLLIVILPREAWVLLSTGPAGLNWRGRDAVEFSCISI